MVRRDLPVPFFFAVTVNTASPFSSVTSLSEEIFMRFLLNYFLTLTFSFLLKPLALKVIVALPFFFAVTVNTASPFSSVTSLSEETFMSFLLFLFNFAVIASPSTAHPSSPVTVTVTSPLFFSLSVNLDRDTEIDLASHTVGAGDTDGVGIGGNVGEGVTVGDGLGVGGGLATGAATIMP